MKARKSFFIGLALVLLGLFGFAGPSPEMSPASFRHW